jgi:hypothetical protein
VRRRPTERTQIGASAAPHRCHMSSLSADCQQSQMPCSRKA